MTFDLPKEVEAAFGSLLANYKLRVVPVGAHEVVVDNGSYALYVRLDREGLHCIYYDKNEEPVGGYNVDLFLIHKRRDKLTFEDAVPSNSTYEDQLRLELKVLVRHLADGGQDILEGKKEWIKDYSWPVVRPPKEVNSVI